MEVFATVTAVEASELTPPFGQEPVRWLLLTDVVGHGYDDAIKIIGWYLCRWQIEIFFKVLTSYEELPKHLPTVGEILSLIAQMGGYLGGKMMGRRALKLSGWDSNN